MADDPSLSHAGFEVTEADLDRTTLSPSAAELLEEDETVATVVGADLGRLDGERFTALFGDALARLRAAAAELPPDNRVYVVGIRTDDTVRGEVDVSEGAPGVVAEADLAFAYAATPDGDGATFAHLTDSLDGVDYLLPAVADGGRLDGPDTTMDAFRRELVARHARRLDALGNAYPAYQEEFRHVLAAPLAAYERRREEV